MSTSSFISPIRVGNSIVCSQNIPTDAYTELYSFGTDSNHFSNLAYLSTKHLSFASASALHIIDLTTGTKTTIPSFTMGGVTCVATTNNGSHLAVGLASEEIGARVLIFRISIDHPEDPVHHIEDPQLLERVEMVMKDKKVDQSQTDIVDEEPLLPPIEVNNKLVLVHEVTLSNIGKLGIESLVFNHDSTFLATVSCAPDYLLSVLNWSQRRLLLKAPAFTSPVYRVSFCKYTTDGLITGGRTHLKFWKMAQTFTGVKLQGELAKFGILDSSDCTAFIELPSGNILSGCGTGEIVLWDSSTVRLVFQRPGGKKCHEGRIEYMYCDLDGLFTRGATTTTKQDDDTGINQPLTTHPPTLLYHELMKRGVPSLTDNWSPSTPEAEHSLGKTSVITPGEQREADLNTRSSNTTQKYETDESNPLTLLPVIITAGSDGYIRLWSGHQLLQAQFLDNNDSIFFEITPVEEIYIGHGSCIRNMVLSPDATSIAMQDAGMGGITIIDIASRSIRRLCYSHGGPVRSIACVNSSTSLLLSGINNDINNLNIRSPLVASIGESGVIFMHDLASRRIVSAKKSASGKGTKLLFIHNGICLVVGYSDGAVRFFSVYYDAQDYAGKESATDEVPAGILDANDCLFLIAAYKCFSDAVVDITCSPEGVVAVLSASGHLFLIQTTLSLVRRGLGADVTLTQTGQEHMSSLAKGLLNVRDSAEDESQKKAFELAVMASSGIFGMTGKDILPLGDFNIYYAIFKESPDKLPQRLGHLFYLEPNVIAMAVLNCTSPEDRLVAITLPSANELIQYRLRSGSSTTDDISSTSISMSAPPADSKLTGEPSSVSYNLMHMFNSIPYFLSVAIPVTPLPGTCEGTIAKVEQAVVQRRISAMLPSRGAMESAMDALLAMEMTEEKQEESTESEDEYDEDGKRIEGKKKKKLSPNDPLYEDMNQPQKFDFVQFNFVNGAGLVKYDDHVYSEKEEGAEIFTPGKLAILVKIFIDEEIRNRAESAMASVRARAEASGATASNIAAGDPALFCAALAVAEARAAYRSSLLYLFDYGTIKKSFFSLINANAIGSRSLLMNSGLTVTTDGTGEESAGISSKKIFVRPEIITPAAHRGPLMDAPALKETEIDDVEFEPQNSKSIKLLMRAPIMSFPVMLQSLRSCVVEDALNKDLLSAEQSTTIGRVCGLLFTIQSGGSVTIEPYRTEDEFATLTQNVLKGEVSNLNPLVAMQLLEQKSEWWTAYCAQAVPNTGLCYMNVGFGGHVCITGDRSGNLLVYGTNVAKVLLSRLQAAYLTTNHIQTFDNGLCTHYIRDTIYSTGMKGFKPSVSLVFHEKVFSLVSKAVFKEKGADILKQQPDAIPLDGDDLDQQEIVCDCNNTEEQAETDGTSKFLTLEQARLSELDSAASKLGQDGKHAVLLKVQGLKALYDTLVKENASLPLEKRLYPHEISPDLLLAHDWVGREERRAHTIIYDELGDILRSVTQKIQTLLANFPVTEFIYTVRAFANPAFQVTTFKLYPFSEKFEHALCEALGIESPDELDQFVRTCPNDLQLAETQDLVSTRTENNIMDPNDTMDATDVSDNSIVDNDQHKSLNQTMDSKVGTATLTSLNATKKSMGESTTSISRSALAPLKSSKSIGSSRLGSVAGTRTIKAIDKIIAQTLSNKLGETTMKQNDLDDTISDAQIKQQRVLQRVEARQKRKEELRALLAEKPDPDKISLEDEKAYEFSLNTFGQFPLKTTEDYVSKVGQLTQQYEEATAEGKQVPPVNMYENKEGRWLQFLLAIKGLHDAQKDFNERVAVLFACKQAVVESVNTLKKEALRITASIKHMAGHLIAADIDAKLAKYEFNADPDKLLSMIFLHPEEIAHIERMEVHDRYIRNWASCQLADTPLDQVDNTSLCLQLQSCYSQTRREFFNENDPTSSDQLTLQYLEFCVANKIVSSEEADRLKKLLSVPATGIQSAVREIVLSTSEALGGLRYGTLPKLNYLLNNEESGSDDSSGTESDKTGDDDENEDEDELVNMCQPYISASMFMGIQSINSIPKGSSSVIAINDPKCSDTNSQQFSAGHEQHHGSASKMMHPLAKDVLLYSGHQIQEATSVRPITTLAAENSQYAPYLYNNHNTYDITSTLAQHNNVQMNVLQGTQSYDSSKAISIFGKMQVSQDYAQRARYWISLALYYRSQMINKMLSLATAFDNAVRELQYSSVQLKMDFARMRIHIISLFQQTEIHHLYITRDAKSMEHLEDCKNEHRQITVQLEQLRKQISQKTEEAMGVGANLQKLLREFNNSISTDAPFRTKLIKIYNKKYRAPKPLKPQIDSEQPVGPETTLVGGGTAKKTLGSTNPEDYMDESDESSELSNLSEGGVEDDDEPVDETVAPEGVSNELFNFILNLRSKKRDYDAQLANIHQEADQLKQQYLILQKKEKAALSATDAANRELTQFRAGKQKELNNVQTAALVTMGQYAYMSEHDTIIEDLSNALLFDAKAIHNLKARIDLRKKQLRHFAQIGESLKDTHYDLLQKEKQAQKDYKVYSEKLEAVQMLKFGQLVDIAKLDSACINEQAEELTRILNQEEVEFKQDQLYKETILERGRDQLKYALDKNTELVLELARLERESLDLDRAILDRQRKAPKAWCSDNKQELVRQEYNSLKQEIINRERELRTLVDEIAILKNHGS